MIKLINNGQLGLYWVLWYNNKDKSRSHLKYDDHFDFCIDHLMGF